MDNGGSERPELPSLAGRLPASELSLLDLVDRLLDRGVVLSGDATISVAGIDLVYLGLRLVLGSVETLQRRRQDGRGAVTPEAPAGPPPQDGMGAPGDTAIPDTPAAPRAPVQSGAPLPVRPVAIPKPYPPGHAAIDIAPGRAEEGLARLVLTVVELIRQLLERQALRRVEGGTLTDEEVERLGVALMQLQEKLYAMAATFGLDPDDLNINLGGLGNLL